MEQSSTKLLRNYWFNELGCSLQDLVPNKVHVVPHGTLKGYSGIYFFKHEKFCVVSTPSELLKEFKGKAEGLEIARCFDSNTVASLIGLRLDRIIGPTWIGEIDSRSYVKSHGDETRLLTKRDWPLLEELLKLSPEQDVQHSALKIGRHPVVGVFEEEKLVAASGFEIMQELVAHIGVLTRLGFRGKGYAKKAISGVTELALDSDLGIQYQTLCSNKASVLAAQKIGYKEFAQTFAARIKDP